MYLYMGVTTIKLQPHISRKILEYPDKLEELKLLQSFLGLVNYVRPYFKNLSKLTSPLYNKAQQKGVRKFNDQDVRIVQKLKEEINKLEPLALPLESDYLVIETDGSELGWGGVLIKKPNEFSSKSLEKICRYTSGTFKEKGYLTSLDYEILAIIYILENFALFILSKKQITIRTDCEAIVKFSDTKNERKLTSNRWLKFREFVLNRGFKIKWEHIKGKDNKLPDLLSRKLLHD